MGTFTLTLQETIEFVGGRNSFDAACLSKYPLFNELHRSDLNNKIVEHYLLREIGQETIPMFLFTLGRKLNEIMPYVNQLFESETMRFDPLLQYDMRTILDSRIDQLSNDESSSTSKGESVGSSTARTVSSEMPSVALSNVGNYATSMVDANSGSTTDNDGEGSAKSRSDSSNINKTATDTAGRNVSGSSLIAEYRSMLLNLDMMIVGELEDCFMQVWTTGDSTLKGPWNVIRSYSALY